MSFSLKNLRSLIQVAIDNNASDIHIRTDEAPCLRIRKELVPIQTKNFTLTDMQDIAKLLFQSQNLSDTIDSIYEYDGGIEIEGLCRLRYNFFRYNLKIGIILRVIKNKIPSIEELYLPTTLEKISRCQRGLILVTGQTGSGKSSTLAAMVNQINSERNAHIITIEDPIEYLHQQKKSRLSQREIGKDTKSFANALRSALRQDPDIILIGEMRDAETMSIALKAAETGHLVLSTLHTTNVMVTIGRILSMFPHEEHSEVRKRLAENLESIICQRMLKSNTAEEVIIACEILITNPGVKECIRGDEPLERLQQIMAAGMGRSGNGSRNFDQHILSLYQQELITKEVALEAVNSEANFLQKLIVE